MGMRSTRSCARCVSLRSGEVARALTSIRAQGITPSTTFALLTELIHRDGLPLALANRHDLSLEPILKFLVKHITDARHCILACDVASVLIGSLFSLLRASASAHCSSDIQKSIRRLLDSRHSSTASSVASAGG